jgi:hypothetical protein
MKCSECGAENADNAEFCTLCLTRFDAAAAEPDTQQSAPETPEPPAPDQRPSGQRAAARYAEAPEPFRYATRRNVDKAERLVQEGRQEEAEAVLRGVVDLYEAKGFKDDAELTAAENHLSNLLLSKGDMDGALEWAQRAADAAGEHFGPRSFGRQVLLMAVGMVLEKAGRDREAASVYGDSAEIGAARSTARARLRGAYAQGLQAICYVRLGETDQVEDLLSGAEAEYARAVGTDGPRYAEVLWLRAGAQAAQGLAAEEEETLRAAAQLVRTAPKRDFRLLDNLLARLAELCEQSGRTEEAEALRAESEDAFSRVPGSPPLELDD